MRVIWNTCGAQCVGCSLISGLPVQGRPMFSREKKHTRKTPQQGLGCKSCSSSTHNKDNIEQIHVVASSIRDGCELTNTANVGSV